MMWARQQAEQGIVGVTWELVYAQLHRIVYIGQAASASGFEAPSLTPKRRQLYRF